MSDESNDVIYRDAKTGQIVTEQYASENPDTTVRETIEHDNVHELSPKDKADLESLDIEMPEFHPILMVWKELLKPARTELDAVITPQWASRICASYQQLTFADMGLYREIYYAHVIELLEILEAEIESDADCLTYSTPEDDARENAEHYKTLVSAWQLAFLQWELDWSWESPTAAIELAAIAEVHKMFFSPTGIIGYLDNIGFQFTEEDQMALQQQLQELKEGK